MLIEGIRGERIILIPNFPWVVHPHREADISLLSFATLSACMPACPCILSLRFLSNHFMTLPFNTTDLTNGMGTHN